MRHRHWGLVVIALTSCVTAQGDDTAGTETGGEATPFPQGEPGNNFSWWGQRPPM